VSTNEQIEATILRLERDGREATLRNDVEAWDALLADTWVNTNADGTTTTKSQLLRLLRERPFAFVAIEDDDVEVRLHAGAAVVTGRSSRSMRGVGDALIERRVRFTRVYVLEDGRWQVAAAQATPIVLGR
jgi:hypothetical protein